MRSQATVTFPLERFIYYPPPQTVAEGSLRLSGAGSRHEHALSKSQIRCPTLMRDAFSLRVFFYVSKLFFCVFIDDLIDVN